MQLSINSSLEKSTFYKYYKERQFTFLQEQVSIKRQNCHFWYKYWHTQPPQTVQHMYRYMYLYLRPVCFFRLSCPICSMLRILSSMPFTNLQNISILFSLLMNWEKIKHYPDFVL